jgi:hypothetical protein
VERTKDIGRNTVASSIHNTIPARMPLRTWKRIPSRISILAQVTRHSSIAEGDVLRVRVVPIFKEYTLLYLVVELEGLAVQGSGKGPLSAGLSTNEAFRTPVETVKDCAIFLLDIKY